MLEAVDIAEHVDELDAQGKALAAAADAAGLAAIVPTCPGWTVGHLLRHVGKVHRWAATYVREGRAAFGGGTARLASAPADGLLDWFVDGHAELVSALHSAPADLDCWTFLPAPSPLAFWARRQAHETAIHRAVADSARGVTPTFTPDFAADGIAELLGGFYRRRGGQLISDPPCSLIVLPADAEPGWHVAIGPDGREISNDIGRSADCVLRGSASDLYLFLWNRFPVTHPMVTGNLAVLELWRERAQIKWR
jgi:uncharacterized protein (TIGR03083 family)